MGYVSRKFKIKVVSREWVSISLIGKNLGISNPIYIHNKTPLYRVGLVNKKKDSCKER